MILWQILALVGLYALVGVAMFVEHRLAANYGRRGRK
jgi:hypothetical protein